MIEKRVIFQRLHGVFSVDDYYTRQQRELALLPEGTPPVHIVIDTSDVISTPNFVEFARLPRIGKRDELGWIVLVITNPTFRFFASMLSQLAKRNYHIVATLDEAWTFLRERDDTLPEKPMSV